MSTTQDRIRISVEDPQGLLKGPWATMSDSGVEWEVAKGREEAGGEDVVTTGKRTRGQITVSRKYVADRDASIEDAISNGALEGVKVSITKIFLDGAYNPIPGKRITKSGLVLSQMTPPESDADSAERAMMQLTFEAP